SEGELHAVPNGRALWGQNGPALPREAAREKPRSRFNNVVLRLVPRNELHATFVFNLAKAHVRVHSMFVVTHLTLERVQTHHVWIDIDLHQPGFILESQ